MFGQGFTKLSFATAIFFLIPSLGVTETLRDSLRNAYQNSGLLVQNRALLRAADERVVVGVASLRPIITWSSNYSQTSSAPNRLTTSLNGSWLLYDFGQSELGIKVLKETVFATRQSLISIEQDVLLRAVTAHMKYLRAVEFVSLRLANVKLITQELSASEDRFEVGEVTRTDVALAEARLANASAGFAAAEGDLAIASAEFHSVTGRVPGTLISPDKLPDLPEDVDAAIALARLHHPDLKEVQYSVAAAELKLKSAKLSDRFSVSGAIGLSNSDLKSNLTQTFGLTAKGTLYSGGAAASKPRMAMAERDATRAKLHVTQLRLDRLVRSSFVKLNVARATGAATDRQVQAASVAFRGVREEASLGARTTLDVLNAEQELLDARVSRISTKIDEQIAAYTALASIGKLTALSLDLGVKTYDPTEYYNLVKTAPIAKSKQGRALDKVLNALVGE